MTPNHNQSVQNLPEVILCFSHLRWDFVYQRPQHILSRLSKTAKIYYIEEPVYTDGSARLEPVEKGTGLTVLKPLLPHGTSHAASTGLLKTLVDELIASIQPRSFGLWYYTPMALPFTRHLQPAVTVFDCMDELSAFRFAPKELLELEEELLEKADVVFTGGASLYEAKKHRHQNIHAFPSSIDRNHFAQARSIPRDPVSGNTVRLGFYGVVDERFDIALLAAMADAMPQWEFEIVGPVVKIDPATLPTNSNILYTGSRTYDELPRYLASWDIALIPFALNESTRFISPTKTPEYLAAGKPVISSPIRDVVNPYGDLGLVHIADTPAEWLAAAMQILSERDSRSAWMTEVDAFLEGNSWDASVAAMAEKMTEATRYDELLPKIVSRQTSYTSTLITS